MIDVQKLAKEAGLVTDYGAREIASDALLKRFAALVLEEAAKVCDARVDEEYATGIVDFGLIQWTQSIAAAIRSLKPKVAA